MYSIFFDYKGITYMLPTTPDTITEERSQANEKFNILKLGEIVIPSHIELKKYNFTAEFPHEKTHYTSTNNSFKNADFYINLFEKVKTEKKPIRFIASNGITEDINTLVLVESLEIQEKAGEEGDKYITFELVEYREFKKEKQVVQEVKNELTTVLTVKDKPKEETNPKSTGSYTIVSGDTLWAVAKKYYGDGSKWPKIYEANKDKIKNPNLIYPKQKITIP